MFNTLALFSPLVSIFSFTSIFFVIQILSTLVYSLPLFPLLALLHISFSLFFFYTLFLMSPSPPPIPPLLFSSSSNPFSSLDECYNRLSAQTVSVSRLYTSCPSLINLEKKNCSNQYLRPWTIICLEFQMDVHCTAVFHICVQVS